jgi:hypothetical protein
MLQKLNAVREISFCKVSQKLYRKYNCIILTEFMFRRVQHVKKLFL